MGVITNYTDANTNQTAYAYDSYGRLTGVTYPEMNSVAVAYDLEPSNTPPTRGNVVNVTRNPKPSSTLASTSISASYDVSCTYTVKCNKPNSTTDANGHATNYAYNNTTGLLTSVTPPIPTPGAVQPQTRLTWTPKYAYYHQATTGGVSIAPSPVSVLTATSACQTEVAPPAVGNCVGTLDEAITTIAYGSTGVANNLLPTSMSSGAGGAPPIATTSHTYDAIGNVQSTTGPLGSAQKSVYLYDADRELIGAIGPNPGGSEGLPYPASRITYNADGLVTETEKGSDTVQTDTNFGTFTSEQQQTTTYDGVNRPVEQVFTAPAGTTFNVSQYTYDNANRLMCSAVRMNLSATLPTTACILGTPVGANGPDQITSYGYDAANELTQVTRAVGTVATPPPQPSYATYTYWPNGTQKTVADAKGNLTTITPDGFDRLSQVTYPSPNPPPYTSNSADYESYVYDANDNIISDRRRSGDTIGFSYDALNRTLEKTPPSGGRNVFYSYDLLNRLLAANYDSVGGNGSRFAYDALGRVTGQTTDGNTLTAGFDAAGDRTSITYSDGYVVNYLYDYLRRPTQVCAPTACPTNPLATYSYDDLGRLTHIARPSLAGTGISYSGPDLVHQLTQQFAGTSADITWTYGYDAANDLVSRAASNDSYTSHPGVLSHSYTTNGLNQYSKIDGATYSYDARGNLTTGGFTYDVDNHLLTGPSTTLGYDPLGRIWAQTVGGTLTRPLFDGGEYIATYDNSGNLLSRVVPSQLGADSPLVWFSGSATTMPSWLHTDNQGSIVAQSNASGTASPATPYGYDPYGVPDTTNGFGGPPLKYTGQTSLPSVALYYYKARMYDPNMGRFLQTDPSGFGGGVNLYAYVHNSPLKWRDPSGMHLAYDWRFEEPGGFAELGGADGGGGGGGSTEVCEDYDTNGGGMTLIVEPCRWENSGYFGGGNGDLRGPIGGDAGVPAPLRGPIAPEVLRGRAKEDCATARAELAFYQNAYNQAYSQFGQASAGSTNPMGGSGGNPMSYNGGNLDPAGPSLVESAVENIELLVNADIMLHYAQEDLDQAQADYNEASRASGGCK